VGNLVVTRRPGSAVSDLSRLILRSYTSCTITSFFLATIPALSLPLVLSLCARFNPKQNNASYLTNCILPSVLRVLISTERQEQSCSSRDLKNRATDYHPVGCFPAKPFPGKPRPSPHPATRATFGASCFLLFLDPISTASFLFILRCCRKPLFNTLSAIHFRALLTRRAFRTK
jgi:hypothetical protein